MLEDSFQAEKQDPNQVKVATGEFQNFSFLTTGRTPHPCGDGPSKKKSEKEPRLQPLCSQANTSPFPFAQEA
jgi:hypothetical protein